MMIPLSGFFRDLVLALEAIKKAAESSSISEKPCG